MWKPVCASPTTLLSAQLDATLAPLVADTQPLQFETKSKKEGQALTVEVSILPTHPRHSEKFCLQVTLDGVDSQTLDFTTLPPAAKRCGVPTGTHPS